jgi:tetratricopeptide (TPR) repeat protein
MKTRNGWLLAAFIVLGFAGVWRLQLAIDIERVSAIRESDELLLTSPRMLKLMSFEFAPLLGQIYWTRAVQYYGEQHAAPGRDFTSLWPLLDIATTLDPKLLPAYRFGSMFLSAASPGGAGRPDQAVSLLQRGIQENPDYWRFYQDLGFIYYMDAKDYPKAAQAFEEGSRKPNAQLWMRVMAAKVAAEGESFETSMFLWRDVYQTAIDPDTKKGALTHLQLLQARQDCKQLDALGEEYEKRFGHRPSSLNQLVQSGILSAMPADPVGFAYVFEADGKAQLNPRSPLVEKKRFVDSVK